MSAKARFAKWLRRFIARYQREHRTPVPQPEPAPKPESEKLPIPKPDPSEHVVRRITTWWGGVDMSTAMLDTDAQLTVSRDGKQWSPAPTSWPTGNAGGGCPSNCNAMACVAYQRPDGSWVGGKFEWLMAVRPNARSWNNIVKGYKGWIPPPAGTEVTCWLYTAAGHRVSREAKAVFQ